VTGRQIGQVPTPWPSWLIAAHPTRAAPAAVRAFLAGLSTHVRAFASREARAGPSVAFVVDKFGYAEADVKVRGCGLFPFFRIRVLNGCAGVA